MKSFALSILLLGCTTSLTCAFLKLQSSNDDTKNSTRIEPAVSVLPLGNDQPIEVGLVKWGRDFEQASLQSKSSGKPVFVLFQEVPGCEGCKSFGREVLSHPLLVEVIEDKFIPVLVYNNRDEGGDAALLKRFQEPAWNYQVIRFLDNNGKDIVPRQDKIWSVEGVANRMVDALTAAGKGVPKYLQTVAATAHTELPTEHTKVAFAMYCFWTGEYELGNIDGVVQTEAGFLDGREVTLVEFDKRQISLEALAKQAAQVQCAQKIFTAEGEGVAGLAGGKLDRSYRPAPAADQKKQLANWTKLDRVPGLNEMQKTKLNALAPRDRERALQWLSPRQRKIFAETVKH